MSTPAIHAPAARSILPNLQHAVWRASQMASSRTATVSSGHPALDNELPNAGWPCSVLIELLLQQAGIGELRLLAPALAAMTNARKTIVLLAPPHIPLASALAELGIDLSLVMLIQADKPADRIWAVEQTLKSGSFGALLCWLPHARADQLRRLQLDAAGCEGLTFVFRPLAAQREPSPAPLRIVCQPFHIGQISVDIIKRRGPVLGQPVLLPLAMPASLQKIASRRHASSTHLRTPHALDRLLPAATAAGRHLEIPVEA